MIPVRTVYKYWVLAGIVSIIVTIMFIVVSPFIFRPKTARNDFAMLPFMFMSGGFFAICNALLTSGLIRWRIKSAEAKQVATNLIMLSAIYGIISMGAVFTVFWTYTNPLTIFGLVALPALAAMRSRSKPHRLKANLIFAALMLLPAIHGAFAFYIMTRPSTFTP